MTPAQRTMTPVPATWDRERLCWAVQLPGKVIYAIDEEQAVRAASTWVGTFQPVKFVGPIVYPRAK